MARTWRAGTYVVTGGAGFLGSHVVDALLGAGFEVEVWDNFSTGKRANVPPRPRLEVVEVDLQKDIPPVPRQLLGVVHCAAIADIRGNWGPGAVTLHYASHVDMTRLLLARVMEHQPQASFVYVSTSAVGVSKSPYAFLKEAAEGVVKAHACAWNAVGWRIIRPVAMVGPRYAHGHLYDFAKQAQHTGRVVVGPGGGYRRSMTKVSWVADNIVSRITDSSSVMTVDTDTFGGPQWGPLDTVEVLKELMPVLCTEQTDCFADARGDTPGLSFPTPGGLPSQDSLDPEGAFRTCVRDTLTDLVDQFYLAGEGRVHHG
jgi:nucleoside-diphosphate-sugar epimerase